MHLEDGRTTIMADSNIPVKAKEVLDALLRNAAVNENLKAFLESAESYDRGETNYNIVDEYLKLSGTCSEILALLDNKDKNEWQNQCIYDILRKVFLHMASNPDIYYKPGLQMVKRIVQNHMKQLQWLIKPNNKANKIKLAMKLLTSMVTLGTEAAKEVMKYFNFGSGNIPLLIRRTNIYDSEDVRACFVQFAVAFLMTGDNALIQQFLQIKGFLTEFFDGLKNDRLHVINLFLTVLRTKVVENKAITKTIKIRLLNEVTLKHVIELYSWVGPQRGKGKKRKFARDDDDDAISKEHVTEITHEDITAVREIAQEFLLSVCCSTKTGILFNDPLLGMSGKNQNHVMTRILCDIQYPYADNLKSDLIIHILQAAPDQLKFYLPTLGNSVVPRPSEKWVQAMAFLKKIVSTQKGYQLIFTTGKKALPKLVTTASTICIPDVLQSSIIEKHLKEGHLIVRYHLLDYTCSVLKKIQEMIQFCSDPSSCLPYTEIEVVGFLQSFRDDIKAKLPEISVIIHCWNKLLQYDSEQINISIQEQPVLLQITITQYMTKVLESLALYESVFAFTAIGNLLPIRSIVLGLKKFFPQMNESEIVEVHIQLTQIVTACEHCNSLFNEEDGEDSAFGLFLKQFVSVASDKAKDCLRRLIQMLMHQTGFFEKSQWEIEVWLTKFEKFSSAQQSKLVDFFNTAVKCLITTRGFSFIDEILECIAQVHLPEMRALETESDLEGLLKKEINKGQISSGGIFDWQHFSPLIPAALAVIEESIEPDDVKLLYQHYVSEVVKDVLHRQYNPQVLCLLINKKQKCLTKDLRSYSQIWLSGDLESRAAAKEPRKKRLKVKETSLSKQLEHFFIDSFGHHLHVDEKWIEKIQTGCWQVNSKKVLSLTSQLLLYLQSELSCFQKDISRGSEVRVNFYVKLIQSLMQQTQKFLGVEGVKMEVDETSCTEGGNFIAIVQDEHQTNLEELCKLCWTTVFSHPVLWSWFLEQHNSLPNVSKDIVTKFVMSNMVHLVNIMDREGIARIIFPYKQKMVELLSAKGLQLFCKILPSDIDFTCILDFFLKYMDEKEIFHIIQSISEKDQFDKDPSNLDSVTSLLLYCLQTIGNDCDSLPPDCVRFAFWLCAKGRNASLESHLSELLGKHPKYCKFVPSDFLLAVLDDLTWDCTTLLDTLLRENPDHLSFVKQKIKPLAKKCKSHPEIFMHLVHTCVCCCDNDDLPFLKSVAKYYWKAVARVFQGPKLCISAEKSNLWKGKMFGTTLHKFLDAGIIDRATVKSLADEVFLDKNFIPAPETLSGIQQLFLSLEGTNIRIAYLDPLSAVVKIYLKCIIEFLKEKQNNEEYVLTFVNDCCKLLQSSKEMCIVEALDKIIWPHLAKITLKRGLKSAKMGSPILQILKECSKCLDDVITENLSVSILYQMIFGHSHFLKVMINETYEYSDVKDSLVDLLVALVTKDTSVCKTEHIPIFLAAYHATLSQTDQKILLLLHLYEKNGANMFEYKPFLWGPIAVSLYSTKEAASLWKEPKMEEVTVLFREDKLMNTALNFPLNMELEPMIVSDEELNQKHGVKNGHNIYDPRFFLPLMHNLLIPESFVHCLHFLESKCVVVIFASLASSSSAVRLLGYQLLALFYQHLEGSLFKDRFFWTGLLEQLKNSIVKQNFRLPCIMTTFLIRVAELATQPAHPVYWPVCKYLLANAVLDIHHIPAFKALFYSSELNHDAHRNWVLSLLVDSMRTYQDFAMCTKRDTLNVILCHCASPVSDSTFKKYAVDMLIKAAEIPKAAEVLVKQYGLLVWINNLIRNSSEDETLCKKLLQLDKLLSPYQCVH